MYLKAAPPQGSRVLLLCWGFPPRPLFAAIFITVSLFSLFSCLQWRIMVWIYGLPRATFLSREGVMAGVNNTAAFSRSDRFRSRVGSFYYSYFQS